MLDRQFTGKTGCENRGEVRVRPLGLTQQPQRICRFEETLEFGILDERIDVSRAFDTTLVGPPPGD